MTIYHFPFMKLQTNRSDPLDKSINPSSSTRLINTQMHVKFGVFMKMVMKMICMWKQPTDVSERPIDYRSWHERPKRCQLHPGLDGCMF